MRLRASRLPSLTAAGGTVRGAVVAFSAPTGIKGGILGDWANGLLGNTFLRHFRVTLDYARQQITLLQQILDFIDNVRHDSFGTPQQKAADKPFGDHRATENDYERQADIEPAPASGFVLQLRPTPGDDARCVNED